MKNFDHLIAEDKENTIILMKSLYHSKRMSARFFYHSVSIFVMLCLILLNIYQELAHSIIFWVGMSIMTVFGIFMYIKKNNEANGYKLIIEEYAGNL